MATPLSTNLTRESSHTIEERNILVTLTANQDIAMKLKGLKSGVVSIPIADLYHQLNGKPVKKGPVSVKRNAAIADEPMISLSRLRSLNMVTPGKTELVSRLDELIKEYLGLIKENNLLPVEETIEA